MFFFFRNFNFFPNFQILLNFSGQWHLYSGTIEEQAECDRAHYSQKMGGQFYSEHAELGSETESRLSDSRRSLSRRQESQKEESDHSKQEISGDISGLKMVQSASLTPFFIGRTHFCTTNLGIWYLFGNTNLYSLCSPGNQHYQKIICFFLIFSSKMSKLGIKSHWCQLISYDSVIIPIKLRLLHLFWWKKLKMNNFLIMLVSWATKS